MDYLLFIIFVPVILGFLIGVFYKPSRYYLSLKKPYIPSGIVFSIVWFIFFIRFKKLSLIVYW